MDKFKSEIEKDAIKLRRKYNIDSYGINDIFMLLEKMDIYHIRLPLDAIKMCGFSTVYEGKKIIVSNSSEILSLEILTTAHSIAHCEYDLDINIQAITIDCDISNVGEKLREMKANYFAKALLMPESKLSYYIKYELEKNSTDLTIVDIIRMQIEFNVSYEILIERLCELKLISEVMSDNFIEEKETEISKCLFVAMNVNDRLMMPSDLMKVPNKYYEYVFSNFENGYISYEKYFDALEIVGLDVSNLKDKKQSDEEDLDVDDIILDDDFEEY